MIKFFNKIILLATAVLFFTVSCKKQLAIVPLSVLDESQALKTPSGIEGAISSVYSSLKSQVHYGRDQIVFADALGDNGFATNHSGRLIGESQNARGSHFVNWGTLYNAINQINLILDAILTPEKISPAPTPADLASWEGQLKFLRALNYFDLVRNYSYIPGAIVTANDKGGVPLMLTGIRTSDLARTAKPSRGTIASVYSQIYSDLTTAESKLLSTATQFPFRASKVAAQALFAKVALYNKDFATAKTWADAVITARGSTLRTTATYVAGWRSSVNPESLFEVAFATSGESLGVNVSMQSSFTSLVTPGVPGSTGGWGDLGAHISLLNALGITLTAPASYGITPCAVSSRTADVRNLLFEPGSTGRGTTFIECTKFLGKNGALYTDNIPVIRIAEVYLIRAEAQSANNSLPIYNLTNAKADLDLIRTNRGLAAFSGVTQTEISDEIQLQRRLELAFEGNRFFDLKRLGKDILKSPTYSDLLFNDYRVLPPIPNGDIQLNPNLIQNVNY
jgi:hypothetical protein